MQRLFDAPIGFSRKEMPVARAIVRAVGSGGVVHQLPMSVAPQRLTRDGFNVNATAHRCVMTKAEAGAGVPWVLYERPRSKGSKPTKWMSGKTANAAYASGNMQARKSVENAEIENHAALDIIEQPNPLQSGVDLRVARLAWIQIHGNCYTFINTVGAQGAARKGELWNLMPPRVKIVPDAIHLIGAYRHDVGGGDPQFFPVSDIIHSKLFSADNDFYGLSLIQVVMRQILTDNEAVQWNYHLLKNSGRPPGVLSIPSNGFVTEDQKDEMEERLDELSAGAANAGRWMLGYGGLKFEKTGFSPAEMEWMEGRNMMRAEIAIELGVAPELIGDSKNKTFSNYKEARKALYAESVLPMLDKERADFNRVLAPRYGDRFFYDYDRDQIEALQEEQGALWERLERATDLTLNEKRAAKGYDAYKPDEQDPATWLFISSAQVPVQDAGIMGTIDDPRNPINHVDPNAAPDAQPGDTGADAAAGTMPKPGEKPKKPAKKPAATE